MVTQCSQSVVCVIILLIDSQTLLSVESNHKNRTELRIHGIMGRRFPDGGLLRYRK